MALGLLAGSTRAQEINAYSKDIYAGRFPQQSGETIYRAICQSCHMADGKGAIGAGAYPSLANDPRLSAARYAAAIVANGRKAMPWFGGPLSDTQIAAVVGYVRTHFGNRFEDPVSPAEVKTVRLPAPSDDP